MASNSDSHALKDEIVKQKYKAATDVCNVAMSNIVNYSQPGRKLIDISVNGEKEIVKLCNEVVKTRFEKGNFKKGVAFPVCISLNEFVSFYCPLANDRKVLKEGDLVKIEFGVHIDGYIAVIAHSFIATSKIDEVKTGKAADAICAAYFASEAALRLFRPGKSISEVTSVIEEIASDFNCNAVEYEISNDMERNAFEADKIIQNSSKSPEKSTKDTFEIGDVFSLNVVISTGSGKTREFTEKPTVFRRDTLKQYNLRMRASRQVFGEIKKKFPNLPFTTRSITNKSARLGMTEILKNQLLIPYQVRTEKKGEFVAQFKTTVVIGEQEIAKCTAHKLPFVKSDLKVQNQHALEVSALSLNHTE